MSADPAPLPVPEEVSRRPNWKFSLCVILSFTGLTLFAGLFVPKFLEVLDRIKRPIPDWVRSLSRLIRDYPVPWIVAGGLASFGAAFVDSRRDRLPRILLLAFSLGLFAWISWLLLSPLLGDLGPIGKKLR